MAESQDDAAFPRGGKQTLPAFERKRLREEAKAEAQKDFLAAKAGPKKRKPNKKEVISSSKI